MFALGNLPAVSQRMIKQEERRLLARCDLEGLPHREVSERLGLNVARVTKRWQRLRQGLLKGGLPETLVILG